MDHTEKILRGGVKKIISQYSPPSAQEECGSFRSSTHPMRELFFTVDGVSRYLLNGSIYDSVPGTVFMIDHWVPHGFGYTEKDNNLLHLWIHLSSPEMAVGLVRVQLQGAYKIDSRRSLPQEFSTLLVRRWDMLSAMKNVSPENVAEYMTGPLNAILEEVAFQLFQQENSPDADNVDSVIEALKSHILMMNARDCSYRKLEQISGFSRFYLAHRFRHYTGCTIGDYIEKVRVEYTAAAFRRGLKQKEIAFELGFSSPSNFWSWLQKHRKSVQREELRMEND